jgi:hypothetical protein
MMYAENSFAILSLWRGACGNRSTSNKPPQGLAAKIADTEMVHHCGAATPS